MGEYNVAWAIPTYNGAKLNETLKSINPCEHKEVIHTKKSGWSLSRAWNHAARMFLEGRDPVDVLILANDDIIVREDTGQLLAEGLLSAQYDPSTKAQGEHPAIDGPELLLVTGYNTNHGHIDIGCRWGMGSADFSLFAIGRRYWEVCGPFDEAFDPCFHEDNDAHWRMRVAGYEGSSWAPYFHWGSMTVKTDAERRAYIQEGENPAFERVRQYYIQKWGGIPGWEKYLVRDDASTSLPEGLHGHLGLREWRRQQAPPAPSVPVEEPKVQVMETPVAAPKKRGRPRKVLAS
jgi:hypothetical protein